MNLVRQAMIAVAMLGAGVPAHSAVTVLDYTFEADTDGPIASFSGTFSIAYDDVTDTASLTALDLTINGTQFTAANAGARFYPDPEVLVFGTPTDISVTPGADDFYFRFNRFAGRGLDFVYTIDGESRAYGGTVRLLGGNAVPEPATWATLVLGFGAAGASLRIRRRMLPA